MLITYKSQLLQHCWMWSNHRCLKTKCCKYALQKRLRCATTSVSTLSDWLMRYSIGIERSTHCVPILGFLEEWGNIGHTSTILPVAYGYTEGHTCYSIPKRPSFEHDAHLCNISSLFTNFTLPTGNFQKSVVPKRVITLKNRRREGAGGPKHLRPLCAA